MEKIEPISPPVKEEDPFILENKDYLLITSINNLANEIQKLRLQNG